ncbi:Afadin and alpha-actinin-binding-domain-containing protein [Aspergillus avenaceus]|uniref:alcohol dehydrogenase (NADP(+)) n=1 Tax=Aspergillus avenaceus TaxID=36643 RepID=A0A5N6TKT8_ASPAV|nr:Afadin and alpha-actinin-binding-domain-containing protein [Aspergillus avenaceus]
MEPHNLEAASTYINNVLLARGLLKSGRPIDFADPENEEGGMDAAMARVINLVNDLVLRRDREAEHRENLANTIRTLRAEDAQKTLEIEKLKTKSSELTRSLALAEAQERAQKTNASSADATARQLKDQVQRMKTMVQQVRAQCANDIRKRDLEMQRLKSHLAERQRGKREGLGVTTININPGVDRSSRAKGLSGGENVNDPNYSLKQETNDFLTELCQNLSDENDTLIMLARNTVQTLKDLQGLPHVEEEQEYSNDVSTGAHKSSHGSVAALPASCEELSSQMDRVLDHLRTLLTNPSFVPLEEVEMRDDEINQLREGWEKMESRWRQAVTMMDGWHKRIADGGGSVQAEELRMGMRLDFSAVASRDSTIDDDEDRMQSPIYEDQEAEAEEEEATTDQRPKEILEEVPSARASQPSSVPEEQPQKSAHRALRERSDNVRPARLSRKVSFTPGLQGSPCEPSGDDDTLPVKAHQAETVTRRSSRRRPETRTTRQVANQKSGSQEQRKPGLTKEQAPTSQTRMSVSEKLAAAESEARAAEQARKEGESRKRGRAVKGSKTGKDRRRSTLTTDELGELLGMPRIQPTMPPQEPNPFKGWVSHNTTDALTYTTYTPKPFTASDIEVAITHCGICGTDIHTLRSGWGPTDYPCVVGHEIIGTIERIGSAVTGFHLGDRVGIGAQSDACLRADCEACADGQENYCPRITGTYNNRYRDEKRSKAYGGFAERWRGPGHFAFKIPDSIPSAQAAPLLCGGVTVFAPLRKYGAGPGKAVGIVGIGGLGHMGILFAKAMECTRVVAISRTSRKRDDAVSGLGADAFIATDEDEKWARRHSRSLDLIICTVDAPDMPLAQYLRMLKVDGTFVQVGAPEKPLPALPAWSLIQKGVKVTGSSIGSTEDIRQMLRLAAEKKVVPWVQERSMRDVNAAVKDMDAGKARYRYVLVNDGVQARL